MAGISPRLKSNLTLNITFIRTNHGVHWSHWKVTPVIFIMKELIEGLGFSIETYIGTVSNIESKLINHQSKYKSE